MGATRLTLNTAVGDLEVEVKCKEEYPLQLAVSHLSTSNFAMQDSGSQISQELLGCEEQGGYQGHDRDIKAGLLSRDIGSNLPVDFAR